MALFLSGDWGTSNLRLRLVDPDRRQVLGEKTSPRGIAPTFEEWRQSDPSQRVGGAERVSFYQSVLRDEIHRLQQRLDIPLQELPLVLSGMASSSLGMMELPYKPVPFGAAEELFRLEIPASEAFRRRTLLVSGIRTAEDVMRGEETQLIGCLSPGDKGERIYIFPGTHSKHVRVIDGQVRGFSTYMTGEFFHLLSAKSVLSGSVSAAGSSGTILPPAFEKGVADSRTSSLLHNAFLVRTNQLFGNYSKEDNYHYLSGLLIGEELKHLAAAQIPSAPSSIASAPPDISVTIVSTGRLRDCYAAACRHLGIADTNLLDADKALIAGHCKLVDLLSVRG